jgi:hypothetical protein
MRYFIHCTHHQILCHQVQEEWKNV